MKFTRRSRRQIVSVSASQRQAQTHQQPQGRRKTFSEPSRRFLVIINRAAGPKTTSHFGLAFLQILPGRRRREPGSLVLMIRAIDLFSGAGGSSWGAKQAGVEIVAGFDLWPLAGKIHKVNFPDSEFIEGRLEDHDLTQLVKAVAARSTSSSHLRNAQAIAPRRATKPGTNKARTQRFKSYATQRHSSPVGSWSENVVSMKALVAYTWNSKTALEDLGIKITEQTLNSAHYGVGQTRRGCSLYAISKRNRVLTPLSKRLGSTKSVVICRSECPLSLDSHYEAKRRAQATLGPEQIAESKRWERKRAIPVVVYMDQTRSRWLAEK